jgi:hypothetical protein
VPRIVLRTRNGQIDTFYQNPRQAFTRNVPAFDTIGGDVRLEVTLDLNGGNWCWLDACASHDERGIRGKTVTFEPGDFIIVVYDVPTTQRAIDNNVWCGVIASTTVAK